MRAAHMVKILSIIEYSESSLTLHKEIGRVLCRRVYLFFIRPITCSTWIRTFNSIFDYSTSKVGCFFPFIKLGICIRAPWTLKSSAMSNPLSASMMSPCSILSRKPLLCAYQYLSHPNTWTRFSTIGDDAYKKLYCIMFLIVRICLGSCFIRIWTFNKNF